MAATITLAFVDNEYVLTDGVTGNVVLNLNDGVSYEFMLDTFMPRPATERQNLADPPLVDGRQYRPGIGKLEGVNLPFSIKVTGTSASDRLAKTTAMLNAQFGTSLSGTFSVRDALNYVDLGTYSTGYTGTLVTNSANLLVFSYNAPPPNIQQRKHRRRSMTLNLPPRG